jgi:hypothetical protein
VAHVEKTFDLNRNWIGDWRLGIGLATATYFRGDKSFALTYCYGCQCGRTFDPAKTRQNHESINDERENINK